MQGEEWQGELIDSFIAAYRVEKSSYFFSRGVEMSVFLSNTNNITMIRRKEKKRNRKRAHIHIGARTLESYFILS